MRRDLAGFQLSLQAAHKFQTGVREPTDDHSWEFTAGLTRKLGRVTLRGQVVYSPDDLGGAERSLYWEAGPALDLGKKFKAFANIGHRARKAGDDYTSFNAGASTTIVPRMTLDLRWYDTSRHELGENFQGAGGGERADGVLSPRVQRRRREASPEQLEERAKTGRPAAKPTKDRRHGFTP